MLQLHNLLVAKQKITDSFATTTEYILKYTWIEIDYRLDVLRATKGAHVEVYECVLKNFLSFILKKYVCIPCTVVFL